MPFKIVRNDITKMKVDVIVNTANPDPIFASGSDSAIYEAAGVEDLLKERRKIGVIEVGQAAITPAFALDATYIIHTVGPAYWEGAKEEAMKLESCYENSLKLALEHKCKSIAFPLISTGIYGYPKGEALQIAVTAISRFLLAEDMLIYLVVFDNESFELSGKLFMDVDSYIDENYVEEKISEEYLSEYDISGRLRTIDEKVDSYKLDDRGWDDTKWNEEKLKEAKRQTDRRKTTIFKSDTEKPGKLKSIIPKPTKLKGIHQEETSFVPAITERSLDDVMERLGETFQQRLLRLVDEKGMTDVQVYKKANLNRKLFSKIRCNVNYKPKKITAVALALALELNMDETKDLLSRAEFALSPSSKFDLIIEYFISREVYDVYTINLALFQHDQPILGE